MIAMEVAGLQVDPSGAGSVLLLREFDEPRRVLPVMIGPLEAFSIAVGLGAAAPPRPLTHDLLVDVLQGTGTEVRRVDVTELRDGTFFAELDLVGPDGHRRLSSRPSDAIALAVRLSVPVYASEDVLAEAGVILDEEDADGPAGGTGPDLRSGPDIDETVEDFRSFLASLDPADFADPGSDHGPDPGTDRDPG
jgi:hypothetical protein